MPIYQNYRNREVTIFLANAVPVKFFPGEHKRLVQEGLEKQYASYLRLIPDPNSVVKEGKDDTKKKNEKGLINEIKQPAKDKELTKEPVEESAKRGRKVVKEDIKLNEGYSPIAGEYTIASTGKQGKE
jgi:hypothetical protein